jgi:DNA-binding SARP family transcriptional activator/WD40 repeat protein
MVRAFGGLVVEGPEGVVDLGGPRPRTVLAVLIAHAGRVVTTDRLVEETWGERQPPGARRTLQAYVAGLRSALGGHEGPLRSEAGGYRLESDSLDIDLDRFEALTRRGRELLASHDPAAASEALARALDVWVGEPFADLPCEEVPALAVVRVHLGELRLSALEARIDADLALGRYRALVPEIERLVALHPEREGLWSQLMVALHESGRSAEALRAGARLRRYMGVELGLEPGGEIRRLEQRISAGERIAARGPPTTCPYKGLAVYAADDADRFFGRERLVDRLVARLIERRLVAVVGASGTGKSSLVRAGLIPAVRGGAIPGLPWSTTVVSPGARPLRRIALPVPDGNTRQLLVIDQFEEVFTLCRDAAERTAFLGTLAETARRDSAVSIVVVARADFYGRLAEHPDLAALVSDGTVLVGPMSPAELDRAVMGPAEHVGLVVEPALRTTILADAAGAAGALPLVSHALLETWARRDGDRLTLAGYREAGGVAGAVAQTAEAALRQRLTLEQQLVARDLLLRLVEPASEGPDMPRTVAMDELEVDAEGDPQATVIEILAAARLLTIDDDGVRLAHEALIREWPTLRAWLDAERQGLIMRRQLTDDARRWQRGGRQIDDLLGVLRLAAVTAWLQDTLLALTPLEHEFVAASAAREARRREDADEQIRRQTRINRRLRVLVTVAGCAFVAAATLGAVALRQRDRAEANAEAARARQLAAEVDALTETDLGLALLVAAESLSVADRAETRGALLNVLAAEPRLRRLVPIAGAAWSSVEISADGRVLAAIADDGHTVVVRSLVDGRPVQEPFELPAVEGPFEATSLAISRDGSQVAAQVADGRVWVLAGASGARTAVQLRHGIGPGAMAFSPGGDELAVAAIVGPPDVFTDPGVAATASIVRIDPRTGARRDAEHPIGEFSPTDLVFSDDGSMLAATDGATGTVRIWRSATEELLRSFLGPAGSSRLAFDTDGGRLAVIGNDETRVYDVVRGHVATGSLGHPPIGSALAFAPDGRLVTGSLDGWRIWDLEVPRQDGPVVAIGGAVRDVQVTADGDVITASADGRVIVWSLDRLPLIGTRLDPRVGGAFSPDVTRLAVTDPRAPGSVLVHDLRARQEIWRVSLPSPARVERLAWAPGSDRIAAVSREGQLVVLSATTGAFVVGPVQLDLRLGSGAATVSALVFSSDGARIVAATTGGRVVVVDAADGTPVADAVNLDDPIRAVVFAPDGRLLVAGDRGTVHSVDTSSGTSAMALRAGDGVEITAMSTDREGRILLAGDTGFVEIWDAERRSMTMQTRAGASAVRGVALSPDGRWLAATSETGQTWLLDATTGAPAGRLGAETSVVAQPHEVAFAPDGDRLYAWDNESYVAWSLDAAEWQAAACTLAGRALSPSERARFGIDDEDPVCAR